jgi:hypothetical protein
MVIPHVSVAIAETIPWRYDRFGRMIAEVGWPRAPKAFKYFHGERLNFGGRKGSKFAKINGVRIMPSDDPNNSQPCVGIFWVAQAKDGAPRLIAAGCPFEQAEPYGDCRTYGPGHYETWTRWRRDRTIDAGHRAIVCTSEYEDWPRGRIVFDRSNDRLILYADRKLMAPEMIAIIREHFHLPADRTSVKGDIHYKT